MSRKKHRKNKKDNKKSLLTFAIGVCFLLIGGGIYYVMHQDNSPLSVIDSSAKKYNAKLKEPEDWAEDRIAFPAFKEVKIEEGSEVLYIALANPEFNEAYLKFEVYLDGDKDALLKTDLVKPGEAVTEVPLPKELKAGEHEIRMVMKGYAPNDDETSLTQTDTFFKLTVLEKGVN